MFSFEFLNFPIVFLKEYLHASCSEYIFYISNHFLKISNSVLYTYLVYALTHFNPTFYFFTPWKCQKIKGFLTFRGSIEMEHLVNFYFFFIKFEILSRISLYCQYCSNGMIQLLIYMKVKQYLIFCIVSLKGYLKANVQMWMCKINETSQNYC